jgi:hypothetical protein
MAGVETATAAGSQPLLTAVRAAFVSGMDRTLWVSAALIAAAAVLALALRPRTDATTNLAEAPESLQQESLREVAA